MSDIELPSEDHSNPSEEDLDLIAEEIRIKKATSVPDEILDRIIEESVEPEPTVNKVNSKLCSCGTPRLAEAPFCHHCGQEFTDITSPKSFASQREPLTEEDGTVHQGRRIRLIGEGWPSDMKMIKDMSDEELEEQVRGLQNLLKKAIQTQDFAQISIAAREFELEYRKHSRYVAAIKRREKLQSQGTLRLNSKQHKPTGPKIPADVQALMSAFNISYEVALQLKANLGKKV
jgi:hypothetical protein